jgi:serine/threonine protein kinase
MNGNQTLSVGTVFAGDFRLLGPLGQGGMGSVYLAEQISTGQRRALKILHEQFAADPAMRARFEQEARIVARIPSDHVVQIIASGVDLESGHPWICMELLDGSSLESRFPLGVPVPWRDLRILLDQLGHALSAAHAAGVVHRDLKPDNIFLARPRIVGLPFLVKLLDFGIAKVLQEARPNPTMALGSPYWMAPEQIDGRRAVSPATDVWALGLLVFRLLTGQLYWKALRDGNESPLLVFQELNDRHFVPPSKRLQELGRSCSLPAGFDRWFLGCVCRDPSGRFPDARAALEAFRQLPAPDEHDTLPSAGVLPATQDAPPSPAPPTPPSRPRHLLLRHRRCRDAAELLREYGDDLSLEGLWVRTSAPLPVGTAVLIDIRMADEVQAANGSGAVTEVHADGMFVRFSGLSGLLVDAMARRRSPHPLDPQSPR